MWFKKKKAIFDPANLPDHIGIIMDGNGRWAKKRGLPRMMGHVAGVEAFRKIALHVRKLGIKQMTFYAFSTENWKRPQEEIDNIMKLLDDYICEALQKVEEKQVRVRFLGDKSRLPETLRNKAIELEKLTAKYTKSTLNIALNYGGRNEITYAVQKLAKKVQDGKLQPEEITEQMIGDHLYCIDAQECDFIIRPSGECRLSNFLLWQSAYSEFWFSDVLWPDFTPEILEQAIAEYQSRQRRFGGI